MARHRTVKPEFWTSEQIVECSPSARLMFIGLWTFCDDAGRHPASIRRLLMEVFPGDNITVDQVRGLMNELIEQELVVEYEAQGVAYWEVTGFTKHQKIERPTYRFPGQFDEPSTSPRRALDEPSVSPRRALGEPSTQSRVESSGVEQSGVQSSKQKGAEKAKPVFPEGLAEKVQLQEGMTLTPRLKAAIDEWLTYKGQKGYKRPAYQVGLLIKQLGSEAAFCGAVEYSIAQGYTGCIKPDNSPNRGRSLASGAGQHHKEGGF